MSSSITEVPAAGSVLPIAYNLLGLADPVIRETNAAAVATGADYAAVFRNARTLDNLGLPAVDGSVDDGGIKEAVADIADTVFLALAEKMRNRAANARNANKELLDQLESVDSNQTTSTGAKADFQAAVASTPTFTLGTLTIASTSAEITDLRALTATLTEERRSLLAAEYAKGDAADATTVSSLTTELAGLEVELARLSELADLAKASEDAASNLFASIIGFVTALVEFIIGVFFGASGRPGSDDDGAAADAVAEGGALDRLFEAVSNNAKQADKALLTQLIEVVDRTELLDAVAGERRADTTERRIRRNESDAVQRIATTLYAALTGAQPPARPSAGQEDQAFERRAEPIGAASDPLSPGADRTNFGESGTRARTTTNDVRVPDSRIAEVRSSGSIGFDRAVPEESRTAERTSLVADVLLASRPRNYASIEVAAALEPAARAAAARLLAAAGERSAVARVQAGRMVVELVERALAVADLVAEARDLAGPVLEPSSGRIKLEL